MKRSLLTLGAALLLSAGVFAQNTRTSADVATNAELAGNDFETTGNGYHFEFNQYTGEDATITSDGINCVNDGTPKYSPSDLTSVTMDADSSWMKFTLDGSGSNWVPLQFTNGNCDKSKTLDLSSTLDGDTIEATVEIRVKATADCNIFLALGSDNLGSAGDHNVSYDNSWPLKANEWTTITYSKFVQKSWSGTNVDASALTALDFQIQATALDLYIDYALIGNDAARPTINALTEAEIANLDAKVFPNPATDVVNVTYNVPADESVVVVLSNSLGQEVASVEGDESSASIDVADLNGGLYFASIIVDGIVVSTQRVVVD